MAGGRLGWYARRLRAMGPAEVLWRARRVAAGAVGPAARTRLSDDPAWWERELAAFRRAEGRPLLLDAERARRIAADAPRAVAAVVAAAERALEHRVQYFGHPEVTLADPVDWHHDPLHDHHWPRVASRRVQHRSQDADPKWIWELNRLQHLPWLAEAWLLTGREEFALEVFAQLDSWVEAHPVGVGIAWRGAFESGIRAPSVLVALQGVRDHPMLDVERFRRVVTVLDAGADSCWRGRSLHSSANNHLIGELVGLVSTALLLPGLPRAGTWRRRATEGLAREATSQVLPDGASAEQAIGYQVFTGDLLLLAAVLLRAGGREAPEPLLAALRRSAAFLAALVAEGEPTPRYGDDDEGFALRLGAAAHPTVDGHLALLAAYAAPDPPPDLDLATHWLRAATLEGPPVAPLAPPGPRAQDPGSLYAPDGGLVVLRSRAGSRRQRVTVDVGPLGYLAIAAHGHADALALTWSLDGRDLVVDPGTGSYYGHPAWRTAHRSTAAHATVGVDGEDSSTMAGPFLWSTHARVVTHEVDLDTGSVEADHDGYLRLDDPVRHRRRVVADPGALGLAVLDLLEADGDHEAVVSWPLAPDLEVRVEGSVAHVLRDGAPVAVITTAATVPVELEVVVADPDSDLGWSSPRLEAREPAPLLRAVVAGSGTVAVATVLHAAGSGAAPVTDLEVTVDGAEASARWCQGSHSRLQECGKPGRAGPIDR